MYIKQYDSNGLVANPITKEQPFINIGKSRRERRFSQRKSNNRKGDGLVVFGNMKYRIIKQHMHVYNFEVVSIGGSKIKHRKLGDKHMIVHSVLVK